MFLTLDFFFFFFAVALVARQSILPFSWELELLLSFFQLASLSDSRHLSASLSAQDDAALSFCDSPVAVSIITSAALMPTLSRCINHVKDGPTQSTHNLLHTTKIWEENWTQFWRTFFAFWGVVNTSFATSKFPELWFFNYQSNIYLNF